MAILGISFVFAALAAWGLTGLVLRYARSHAVIDIPNDRSSHVVPTPRGGGIAIVLVVSVGVALLFLAGNLAQSFVVAFLGGGLIVAAVGWTDDSRGVKAAYRAVIHSCAAAWAVYWIGGISLHIPGIPPAFLAAAGIGFAILTIVWFINLYNFMDGIDGIGGLTAVTSGVFGALLLLNGGNFGLASVPILLAGASLGFLVWNWSPARIFLGDVGSGTLGFYFGVLGLGSENLDSVPFVLWILLLGVFVADATLTLARRVIRGERWHDAHKKHAYQRAVQAGYSHARVSLFVAATNIALGIAALAIVNRAGNRAAIAGVALVFLLGVYLVVEKIYPMPRGGS